MLERGSAHPVLRPLVLILLVLILALTFVHASHDGWDNAIEMGVICYAFVAIVGLVARAPRGSVSVVVRARWVPRRGPPRPATGCPSVVGSDVLVIPLRR